MKEKLEIVADLKNGNVELGFAESEMTIAEASPEYAQVLCNAYNEYVNKKS